MAIYGDVLAAFPELLREYQIFTMDPITGAAGYANRKPLCKRTGTFVKGAKSQMKIQGEARVTNETGVFYCYEFNPIELVAQGTYFEEDGQIFVFKDDQVFAKEAGFGAYGCQLVQGNTDKQVENTNVTARTVSDYPE